MRFTLCLLVSAALAQGADLPLRGLASVGFRVSDLENARRFYTGILGFEEAFSLRDERGALQRVFLKVNDEQFIELWPGLRAEEDIRLVHVAMQTTDARRLHGMLEARGLAPSSLERRADGALGFWVRDPDGTRLEFIEYLPDSLQARARGRFLSPRRISERLRHAGVTVRDLDRAMAFYGDRLGFRETWRGGPTEGQLRWVNLEMPGARDDYLEFMLHSAPLTRSQLGSMQHICLETPDIQAAYRKAVTHGLPDIERHQPRIGRNGRWLANLFDPDGTRTELMEPHPAGSAALR